MKDCEHWQEMMSCMIDGELDKAELEALKTHIAGCPECAALFEAFSSVSTELGKLEEPPESVAPRVMYAIRGKKKNPWVRILPLAACLAVAIFFGVRKTAPDIIHDSDSGYSATFSAAPETKPPDTERQAAANSGTESEDSATGSENLKTDEQGKEECKSAVTPPVQNIESAVKPSPTPALPAVTPDNAYTTAPESTAKPDSDDAGDGGTTVLMDAQQIAALIRMIGAPDNAPVPDIEAEPDYSLALISGGRIIDVEIYIIGDTVYVDMGGGLFTASCTADELREFISGAHK